MLIDSDSPRETKLPVFLKTLCILTFISCGIAVVTTIYGLSVQPHSLRNSVDQLIEISDPATAAKLEETFSRNEIAINYWTKIGHFLVIANIIVSATGALLMWKRKRSGFYIYAAGRAFPVIATVTICYVMLELPYLGFWILAKGILTIIISIVFVILYGMNLKHMNR